MFSPSVKTVILVAQGCCKAWHQKMHLRQLHRLFSEHRKSETLSDTNLVTISGSPLTSMREPGRASFQLVVLWMHSQGGPKQDQLCGKVLMLDGWSCQFLLEGFVTLGWLWGPKSIPWSKLWLKFPCVVGAPEFGPERAGWLLPRFGESPPDGALVWGIKLQQAAAEAEKIGHRPPFYWIVSRNRVELSKPGFPSTCF